MRVKVFIFFIFLINIFFSINIFSNELKKTKYKNSEEALNQLVNSIEKWLGTPYKIGGFSKSGVDCSGFASIIYKDVFDINLPRTTYDQSKIGIPVKDTLKTGDLLFFNTTGKLSHIGIYLSDNKFVHAASQGPSLGVIKSSLNEKYYKNCYLFAKRVVDLNVTETNKDDKINVETQNIELILGNTFYNDKVVSENKFKNIKKIFFQINNFSKNIDDIVLEIVYNNSNINRYIIQFDNNRYISKIDVLKGVYSFRVLNNNNLLVKKEIVVE